MRRIDTAERRARLGRQHALAGGHLAADALAATSSMVCLHATDPASVYLSARARVSGLTREALDRELYDKRTLVKHLSMRRTLFVFPRDLLAAATAGPGARVADSERRKTSRAIEASGVAGDGTKWLARAEAAVLAALDEHGALTSSQLSAVVPLVSEQIRAGGNGKWGQDVPVAPRLLTILSASGQAVRGSNQGSWNVSRPIWSTMSRWLGEPLVLPQQRDAMASMVHAWLRAFGPGTANDLKWWLGSTVADVKHALAAVEAVEVLLDDGAVGYVLPDDVEPAPPVEPWTALLPALDPTTMGWADRDWYLGPHRSLLFDTNGNAGPTAWCDGRVVGGWHQEPSGAVVLNLIESLPKRATQSLARQARELTDWLAGQRVLPRFPSPLFKTGTGR